MKPKIVDIKRVKADENFWIRKDYNKEALHRYKELHESGRSKPLKVQRGTLRLIDGVHCLWVLKSLRVDRVEVIEVDVPDNRLRAEQVRSNIEHGAMLTQDELIRIIKKLYYKDHLTQKRSEK